LDDTGSNPTVWRIETCFNNTIQEQGIGEGTVWYPDTLNSILESFFVHETGDLTLPTRGTVRARLEGYSRSESYDMIDTAMVSFTFVEDNEDSVDASSYSSPSVSGSAITLKSVTEFSAQSSGMWDGSLQDLNELIGEMEGLASLPDKYAAEITEKTKILQKQVDRIVKAHSKPWVDGRDTMNNPENSRTARVLVDTKAAAFQTSLQTGSNRKPYQEVQFERDQSLASIASMLGQVYSELLAINDGFIEDPTYVPAGTLVRVFADG
jgi:hypothetical protein